jgi:hypothetical protein
MTQSEGPQYPGLTPGDQYANPNAMGGKVGSFAPTGQPITRDEQGNGHCPSCGGTDFAYGGSLLRKYWRLSLLGRLFVKPDRQQPKPRSGVVCNKCGAKCVWDASPRP